MLEARGPFVLIDGPGSALLYRKPVDVIETREPEEVNRLLGELRSAAARGLHAAGFVAYEAGHALEPKLAPLASAPAPGAPPLLWFGLFEAAEEVEPDELLPDPCGGWCGPPVPRLARHAYEEAAARIKAHIEAGDIYQANFTFAAEIAVAGDPLALYAGLRRRGGGGHGGIVFTGAHWLLSCSPELFFTLAGRQVTARPMKGTARRGTGAQADREAAAALAIDPKQRAENLMIVDLIRNDLSRVSKPGSVEVPQLFAVETYPTVHQMTSTVTAELEQGRDAIDLLAAAFPCGSVTGAPKIRAMEIIDALEAEPRGPYTGSIGRIAPDGEAHFNVAIRTLCLATGETRATIGLGSAIVADSEAGAEWRECLAKGAFVTPDGLDFDLIETMRFDHHEGVAELERHLARMKRSAAELGFAFDRHAARNDLQAATFRLREERRLRLRLSRSGTLAIEGRPLHEPPVEPVSVAALPLPVARGDFRLRHKTSDRAFYDEARIVSGAFEVIFEDREGFLTEGSFTNIFVERSGRLLTPPLGRGLLPGILREALIDQGQAEEADLTIADLADGFYVGNMVRGLLRAALIA